MQGFYQGARSWTWGYFYFNVIEKKYVSINEVSSDYNRLIEHLISKLLS
jgi:hypothetical protein